VTGRSREKQAMFTGESPSLVAQLVKALGRGK
jgi:hypothetical protein